MTSKATLGICCLALLLADCHRHKPIPVSEILLMNDAAHKDRILRGVYPGENAWRWTAPSFALSLDAPGPAPTYLEMDFTVPDELMTPPRPITVIAKVNGIDAGRQTYETSGRYLFAAKLADAAMKTQPATVEFAVDRSVKEPGSGRDLGLIVVSVGLKQYERTTEARNAELVKSHEAYLNIIRQRDLKIPPDKQTEIMRIFHDLPIWESLHFEGVQIIKNPLDLWVMQDIAWEVRPDFVIETGTFYGGSALYWAHTLNGMGLENARVLTVDIQDLTKGASTNPLWKHVDFYLGSSTDPKIVDKMAARVKNSRVIVNLDSDHARDHVLRELHMYAPLVSAGSYIAVEDTHLDGVPTHPEQGPGPMAAVRQFLSEDAGKDFEQDFTREAMVMTSYPGGWLRRKK
ncbi:MAG TPA: CmcI family methyltransferase [Bryobacteraceae bacterium]|nr:CmcI family methyltransferase [Bryobacteraceae bacterium]